jgi:tetratricopeptide (TPR) repeat protein
VRRPVHRHGRSLTRRLHRYVRGLLLAHRGQNAEAEREFRRAVYSLTGGFSRINLELARTLLALGRAEQAVTVLEAALRGSLEASGLYLTRPGLHLELAGALELAGRQERALEHLQWALKAWERADPMLDERKRKAQAGFARLKG